MQNKVYVTETPGNKVSITEDNAVVQVLTETVKVNTIGIQGPPGSGDKTYVHVQNTPAAVWTVSHNLGKKSTVVVVDSADEVVYGEINYVDNNTITLTFVGAFSGKAYFN